MVLGSLYDIYQLTEQILGVVRQPSEMRLHVDPDVAIEQVDLDELLSRSDIISLHLPLTNARFYRTRAVSQDEKFSYPDEYGSDRQDRSCS